jgi:hypothetical protein
MYDEQFWAKVREIVAPYLRQMTSPLRLDGPNPLNAPLVHSCHCGHCCRGGDGGQ